MKTQVYHKTYGIEKGWHKGKERYFVVANGKTTSLHYAKPDFAMKQAEQFIRACHKPFLRDRDQTMVSFTFTQI